MRIGSNVDSVQALTKRYLSTQQDKSRQSFNKLASGLRIAQASDDASGLGISDRMRSQIRSLDVASRNTMEGIHLAKTAESALGEVSGTLSEMRELAVRASNGTIGADDKAQLHAQFQEMAEHLEFLGDSSEFNGQKLLNGSSTGVEVQTSAEWGETTSVPLAEVSAEALGIDGIDLEAAAGASGAIAAIDEALTSVGEAGGELGATVNSLGSAHRQLSQSSIQVSRAESQIRDVDMAMETAVLVKQDILAKGSVALLSQGTTNSNHAKNLLG